MGTEFMLVEDSEPLGRVPYHMKVVGQHRYRIDSYVESVKGSECTDGGNGGSFFNSAARIIEFRRRYYDGLSDDKWNDWHWQLRNRITSLHELERVIFLNTDERKALKGEGNMLPFAITPYYAALLHPYDLSHALRRTVIPDIREKVKSPGESEDPLNEDGDSPMPGLVHRYPDRVLFLVTDFCSTYCRYCTRSRMVGRRNTHRFTLERWSRAINYIRDNSQIRDVLLSGGDPLTLSDGKLEWLLSRLREIPHVGIIRIGTKAPVVLPQRITPRLTRMLKRYHPLWMSIHFTHPEELTEEVKTACASLANAGIPLQSQTVLLSGINDDKSTMGELFHGLIKMRVRPYYLYQCDPIVGSAHFRTSVRKGLDIIDGLRGYTTGFAVPLYVIDLPGGGGKIPIMPDYVVGHDGDDLVMRNYRRQVYRYFDPEAGVEAKGCFI